MDRSKKGSFVEGTPQFVPVNTWYNFMFGIENGLVEHIENQNVVGMVTLYRYMYSKLKPYIEQYMIKEDHDKLDLKDIYKLQSELMSGDADFVNKHNSGTYQQINELIMDKIDLVNQFIAKSELYLPLKKVDRRPAVLKQDDW